MKKWIFGLIALFIVLCALFTPMILSSNWGNSMIASSFSKKKDVTFSFKKLKLSWLGPQKIEALVYKKKNLNVSVPQIASKDSLFRLIATFGKPKDITITSPDVLITPSFDTKGHDKKNASHKKTIAGNTSSS